MLDSLISHLIPLIMLLGLSAFFAGAETVFFSLNRSQLAQFKESKSALAKQLLHFLSKPKDILVTILFGNELTNIAISILVASLFYELFSDLDIKVLTFLSVGVGTFLVLVIGEIIPKSIGLLFAPLLAPVTALLLQPLYTLLKPFRFVLVKFADWFIRKTGGSAQKQTPLSLEEEFHHLLELSAKSGELEMEEKELIQKAITFKNKVVLHIMTPMREVSSLPIDMPYPKLLEEIKITQFSRIPIYEGTAQNVIGLLYVKDLFKFDRRFRENPELTIREILRPLLFVTKEERLEDLLQKIKETRIHMAIVVNPEKKPIGLVTLDDIVKELFGEFKEDSR